MLAFLANFKVFFKFVDKIQNLETFSTFLVSWKLFKFFSSVLPLILHPCPTEDSVCAGHAHPIFDTISICALKIKIIFLACMSDHNFYAGWGGGWYNQGPMEQKPSVLVCLHYLLASTLFTYKSCIPASDGQLKIVHEFTQSEHIALILRIFFPNKCAYK